MPKNNNHSSNRCTAVKMLTQACSGFTRAGDLHPSRTFPEDSANQRQLREPQIHTLDLENIPSNIFSQHYWCSRYIVQEGKSQGKKYLLNFSQQTDLLIYITKTENKWKLNTKTKSDDCILKAVSLNQNEYFLFLCHCVICCLTV